jgi:RNA polymerase sigma-70 factor (ECF subfamily)
MQQELKEHRQAPYDQFLRLYFQHRPLIEQTVKRFLNCKADIDDILQEVFIIGWEHFYQIKSMSSFVPWLQTIARRLCIRELSRNYRQWETLEFGHGDDCDQTIESLPLHTTTKNLGSLSWPANETWCNSVKDSTQTKVGINYYFHAKSIREICTLTGINRNTVLSHLRRFRLDIKQKICEAH